MVVAVVTEKGVLRMLVLGAVLRIRAMIVISKLVSIPFLNVFHRTEYIYVEDFYHIEVLGCEQKTKLILTPCFLDVVSGSSMPLLPRPQNTNTKQRSDS